ncbi:MAG TPA: hypothetical protein DCE56_15775 [Cyanobacteria bacterium UBA8553]|nr:hypothetical protein [Cyanobacteria bacterium UBA8553]HAJ59652.1 hypothetical protein [Cyanobacteria bacterium UBA8543]
MLTFKRFAGTVSVVLLTLTSACSSSEQPQATSSATTSPKLTAPTRSPRVFKAKASSPNSSPQVQAERFLEALDTAMGAASIAQSAQSNDDWNLVVSRWQRAINLLRAVPQPSANYAIAQKKIAEYQRNLAYAQKQQNSGLTPIGRANPRPVAAVSRQTKPSAPTSAAPKQTRPSTVTPEVALATHLKKIGAKFYGTYWCPYCTQQKDLFGTQAFRQINYIECDEKGKNARPDLCIKANISGFPTWEIKGKLYSGLQSLQALADLSGYQGDRNFKR